MHDDPRRQQLEVEMDMANAAERAPRPSDIDRLRAARREPEVQRSRPGSLGAREAEALVGEQVSSRQDDPLGTYGYGSQLPIGITADRVATLDSALERTGEERAVREAPAALVEASDPEVIDPRGRLSH